MSNTKFNLMQSLAATFQPAVFAQHSSISLASPFSRLHYWLDGNKLNINKINRKYIYVSARGDRNYSKGELIGKSLFYLDDKPFGVEPGFLTVPIDENFFINLRNFFKKIKKIDPEAKDNQELQIYLINNKEVASEFASWLIEYYKGGTKTENDAMWLFKQDYDDPGITRSNVAPRPSRLANSSAVKGKNTAKEVNEKLSIKRKVGQFFRLIVYTAYKNATGNRIEENCNAIFECLATDIAKSHGMSVQTQRLIFSQYADGFLKVMTSCKWEPKLQVFQGCLGGDGSHQKYLLKVNGYNEHNRPVFAKNSEGKYYAEDAIVDLGFNLALLLTENDRDAIGSAGQNKGKINNRLFGFDFGQAYRRKNTIVDTLSDDFSFTQSDGNDFIKNISIFYDTPLSERMAGIFFLYQITDEETLNTIFNKKERQNIQAAIEHYKIEHYENVNIGSAVEFKGRIERIQPGAEDKQFDAYIDTFKQLAATAKADADEVAADQFESYVEKITKVKENAKATRVKILEIFKARMQLTSEEVDLLDNLEKLSSPTSMLSNDDEVMLNHLRILPDAKPTWWQKLLSKKSEPNRVSWQMKKEDSEISVSTCLSRQKAETVLKVLEEYLAESSVYAKAIKVNMKLSEEDPQKIKLTISCSKGEINNLINLFQETHIIRYKSRTDPHNHPAGHFKIQQQYITPGKPTKRYMLSKMSSSRLKGLKLFATPSSEKAATVSRELISSNIGSDSKVGEKKGRLAEQQNYEPTDSFMSPQPCTNKFQYSQTGLTSKYGIYKLEDDTSTCRKLVGEFDNSDDEEFEKNNKKQVTTVCTNN